MNQFSLGVFAPWSVGLLFALALIWVVTRDRRRLREKDDILAEFVPGQLDALEPFLKPRDVTVLEQDIRFWLETLELAGMKQRAQNASAIVHFVQHLCKDQAIADKQLQFMITRAAIVRLCTRFFWTENLLRVWHKEFPHVLARTSGIVYYEMAQRVTTLCEEYAPALSERLSAVL